MLHDSDVAEDGGSCWVEAADADRSAQGSGGTRRLSTRVADLQMWGWRMQDSRAVLNDYQLQCRQKSRWRRMVTSESDSNDGDDAPDDDDEGIQSPPRPASLIIGSEKKQKVG